MPKIRQRVGLKSNFMKVKLCFLKPNARLLSKSYFYFLFTKKIYLLFLCIVTSATFNIYSQSFCGCQYDYIGDTLILVGVKYKTGYPYSGIELGKTNDLWKGFDTKKLTLKQHIKKDESPAYFGTYVVTNMFYDITQKISKYTQVNGVVLELKNCSSKNVVYYFLSENMKPINFPFEYNGDCPKYDYYSKFIRKKIDKFEGVEMNYAQYDCGTINILISQTTKDSIEIYSFTIIAETKSPMHTNGLYVLFSDDYRLGSKDVEIETKYQGDVNSYSPYKSLGTILLTAEEFGNLSSLDLTAIRIGSKDYYLWDYEKEEMRGIMQAFVKK